MNRRQFLRAAPAAPIALVTQPAAAAKPPLYRVKAATPAEKEALLRAVAAIGPGGIEPLPQGTIIELVREVDR
jgi:hypothetical protein